MIITSSYRFAKSSSQKCRLVVDLIRNKPVLEAETILQFTNKKASKLVAKALNSAIANASHNHGISKEALIVKKILVEKGPAVKRIHARAKGRAYRVVKQYCHIFIHLSNTGVS
ncbi:MAG: 50S ribosomal protein L22 [Methylacidiphilales bacterium]|nr:50S ribosomal protein L22 [Candidatus Methylacidiphilales bacterium]